MHWITDDAVLDTVIEVAFRKSRFMQQFNIAGTEYRLLIRTHEMLFDPNTAYREIAFIHVGRAGHNTVEVPGKALRLDHALIAAGGAPDKVRFLRLDRVI